MSPRTRILAVAAATVALVAAASGITYAATSTPSSTSTYAVGCVNSHHAFHNINSDGTCPTGYSRINLAAAATPLTVSVTQTGQTATKQVSVAGITVRTTCTGGGSAGVYFVEENNTNYDVRGLSYVTGTATEFHDNTATSLATGSSRITYPNPPGAGSDIVVNAGELTADLLVVHSGHTFTLHFDALSYSGGCSVQAQVTPSS